MSRYAVGAILTAGLLALSAAPAGAEPPMPIGHEAAPTGSAALVPMHLGPMTDAGLVERDCAGCHALSMVTDTGHTPEEWSDIVDRMAGYGLGASTDELHHIKDYLARTAPAAPPAPAANGH